MSYSAFDPGCGCKCQPPPSCLIGEDEFEYPPLEPLWETTGVLIEADGLLEMAAGSSAIFVPMPSSELDAVLAETFARTEDATATVRVKIALADDDHYLFGEFAIAGGVGTLRLGQVAGGSGTYLTEPHTVADTGLQLNERHRLALCWTPGVEEYGEQFQQLVFPTAAVGEGWTGPTLIFSSGGGNATYTLLASETTEPLTGAGFPIVIPPGSTIDGLELAIVASIDPVRPVTLTRMQLSLAGIAVGDNLAGSQTITGLPLTFNAGGPTTLWNLPLTWENIVSLTATVEFTGDYTAENVTVSVDVQMVTVWFTTPDHRPGKLQFAYTGSNGRIECITDFAVFISGDLGRKSGLGAVVGNWDFSSFHYRYQYSLERPHCPPCGDSIERCEPPQEGYDGEDEREDPPEACGGCHPDFPPDARYVLDATAVDLTADPRNLGFCAAECEAFARVYVVQAAGACLWNFPSVECGAQKAVALRLIPDGSGGYKWRAQLGYSFSGSIGGLYAIYEAPLASEFACRQMPVTLTKVAQYPAAFPYPTSSTLCEGTWPNTIELDLA